MAAEAELKLKITPELSGLDEVIGQLRGTGNALIGLADSLQRLSDGSPDAARTVRPPVRLSATEVGICPYVIIGKEHDAHRFQIDTDTSEIGAEVLSFDCPGSPVRPWHEDKRPG